MSEKVRYQINMRALMEECMREHLVDRLDPRARLDPRVRLDPRFRLDPRARLSRNPIGEMLGKRLNAAVHAGDRDAIALRNALEGMASLANEVAHDMGLVAAPVESQQAASRTPDAQPRLGAWLLDLVVARSDSDQVIGDLEEGFQRRRREGGRLRAIVWYWCQVAWETFDAVPRRLSGLLKLVAAAKVVEKILEWLDRR